jgi:hypothetical protein
MCGLSLVLASRVLYQRPSDTVSQVIVNSAEKSTVALAQLTATASEPDVYPFPSVANVSLW